MFDVIAHIAVVNLYALIQPISQVIAVDINTAKLLNSNLTKILFETAYLLTKYV